MNTADIQTVSPDTVLIRAGRIGWPVHAVVVLLTAAGLHVFGHSQLAALFAAAALPLSLAIAALMFRPIVLPAYFVLTGLAGVLWGALSLAAARTGSSEIALFVTLVVGGTAAAAIAIQFPRPWLAATSLVPALSLLALAHLLSPSPVGAVIAPMVAIYGLLLALLTRYMSGIFMANAELSRRLAAHVEALETAVQERDRAMRVKTRLLSHAGHDMRQALHAVKFVLHFLRDQEMPRETRDLVARGLRSLDTLSLLFQSIQDIGQIQAGRITVRTERLSLGALLERAASSLAGEAEMRGIDVRTVPCSAAVVCDPVLLQRIVQNIAANAVKFARSRVLIGVRRAGPGLRIEVLDDGPGIPEASRAEIFEEFTQLQPGSGETPGLGLGLAIVRELCLRLGLHTGLSSIPGRGTRMMVAGLEPAAQPKAAGPAARIVCGAIAGPGGEAEIGRACALMAEWGYEVRRIETLQGAVENGIDTFVIAPGDAGIAAFDDPVHRPDGRTGPLIWLGAGGTPVAGSIHLGTGWRPAHLRSALLSRHAGRAEDR